MTTVDPGPAPERRPYPDPDEDAQAADDALGETGEDDATDSE